MSFKKVLLNIIGFSLRIIVLMLIVMFVYKTSLKAYEFGFRVFSEQPVTTGDGRDIEVTIPMGASVSDIGDILEEKGLIRESKLFFLQEKLSAYRGKLQPGFYCLNTSMKATEMMEIMAKKDEDSTEDATESVPATVEASTDTVSGYGDGESLNGLEGTVDPAGEEGEDSDSQ